jgi:NAD(P)H-hydrate epimerase
MKRAASVVLEELLQAFGQPSMITVFCGVGNNGGDGYIVAALAAQKNIPVRVVELGAEKGFTTETQQAKRFALQANVDCIPFNDDLILDNGVVVDSLLGTRFVSPLRTPYDRAIKLINHCRLPVLSVDIPSGLETDTGAVVDVAVKADLTVTFIGAKKGLFTGGGPSHCGDIIYHSLDVPHYLFEQFEPAAQLLNLFDLMDHLPEIAIDAYKHQRGHTLVLGGDLGFGGAVSIAAEASLKIGSGLVSVATRPEHISAVLSRRPELMACGVTSGQALEPLLEKPTVLVAGPGLGSSAWSQQLLQRVLASDKPLVLDADALNILADSTLLSGAVNNQLEHRWVLTPHPGEAARLLGVSVDTIQADRYAAVQQLQQAFKGVVLLKGPGTLIYGGEGPVKVCPYGNPALATAGTGDLLSGIIGGLIAQGVGLQHAAELGCCIHATAADMAVQQSGERCLVATDLLPYVHRLLNREYL